MALERANVKREGDGGRVSPEDLLAAWILPGAVRRAAAGLRAALFDLDGVLVDTAEFHYLAWKQLADELGLRFDRHANEGFRGVGRMECLELLLGGYRNRFVIEEKKLLAERKNGIYLKMIETLTPADVLPGVKGLLSRLRAAGIGMAVVSASRNAGRVLEKLELAGWFDAVVDGTQVSRSKPDPEGFLLAAGRLGVEARACLVVEDAEAGIEAARRAGMKSIGITAHAVHSPLGAANLLAAGVGQLTVERMSGMFGKAAVLRAG